jgi:hypothetical protein
MVRLGAEHTYSFLRSDLASHDLDSHDPHRAAVLSGPAPPVRTRLAEVQCTRVAKKKSAVDQPNNSLKSLIRF